MKSYTTQSDIRLQTSESETETENHEPRPHECVTSFDNIQK